MEHQRRMPAYLFISTAIILCSLLLFAMPELVPAQPNPHWGIHDMNRPKPAVVNPGTASTQERPGEPPSDAIVLFNGTGLSQWCTMTGEKPKWKTEGNYLETVAGKGPIRTWQAFGDCQLHIEWATPNPPHGTGQGRGNSGVFLMGRYEVQVLDSYKSDTYADGQASAIYGQYPPLVNACRAPGQWQTYDIIFHRPHFSEDGKLIKPARITVLQNGVLTQDNVEILGPTNWQNREPYEKHPDKLFLALQDHHNPIRYRNIWIRELSENSVYAANRKQITIPDTLLNRYVGTYGFNGKPRIFVSKEFGQLYIVPNRATKYPLNAESLTRFFTSKLAADIVFDLDKNGNVTGLTEYMGGGKEVVKKIK